MERRSLVRDEERAGDAIAPDVTAVLVTTVTHGTLSLNSDGSFAT
jgi:hypothetical protein